MPAIYVSLSTANMIRRQNNLPSLTSSTKRNRKLSAPREEVSVNARGARQGEWLLSELALSAGCSAVVGVAGACKEIIATSDGQELRQEKQKCQSQVGRRVKAVPRARTRTRAMEHRERQLEGPRGYNTEIQLAVDLERK